MLFKNLVRTIETVRYLKPRQIAWQLARRLTHSDGGGVRAAPEPSEPIITNLVPRPAISGVSIREGFIEVLGKMVFDLGSNKIIVAPTDDYMYEFSLCYLDFLPQLSAESSCEAVGPVIIELRNSKYFYHPYVVAKRIQSSVEFLSTTKGIGLRHRRILIEQICTDYEHLRRNIEYQIDGNHLLTNFASLSIASSVLGYSSSERWAKRYWQEFDAQFRDGLHFERSVSYTKQLISEALLVFQISKVQPALQASDRILNVLTFLCEIEKLGIRLNFGDNIEEQAPELAELLSYSLRIIGGTASKFEIATPTVVSGYAIAANSNLACSIDIGVPSPSYQPGHAHDSTGGVEISVDGAEIFGCGGISTYEDTKVRSSERSRWSYSKVTSVGVMQDVWKSFRVARRIDPEVSIKGDCILMRAPLKGKAWTRRVELHDSFLNVIDELGGAELTCRYIINPEFTLRKRNAKTLEILGNGKSYQCTCVCDGIDIASETFGQKYGSQESRQVLILHSESGNAKMQVRKVN